MDIGKEISLKTAKDPLSNNPDYLKYSSSQLKDIKADNRFSGTLEYRNEHEIRKLIERELNPYMDSVRKEIRLNIDNFLYDIGEYKRLKEDMNKFQVVIDDHKKTILLQQREQEIKIQNHDILFKTIMRSMEDSKLQVSDLNRKVRDINNTITDNELNNYKSNRNNNNDNINTNTKINSDINKDELLKEASEQYNNSVKALKDLESKLNLLNGKMNSNNDDFLNALKEIKDENILINEDLTNVEKQFEQNYNFYKDKFLKLETDINNTDKEINLIKQNNDYFNEKLCGLESNVNEFLNIHGNYNKNNNSNNNTNTNNHGNTKDLENEINDLKGKLNNLNKDYKNTTQLLKDLDKIVSNLNSSNNNNNNNKNTNVNNNDTLEILEIEELPSQNNNNKNEMKIKEELESKQKELEKQVNDKISSLKQSIDNLNKDLVNLSSKLDNKLHNISIKIEDEVKKLEKLRKDDLSAINLNMTNNKDNDLMISNLMKKKEETSNNNTNNNTNNINKENNDTQSQINYDNIKIKVKDNKKQCENLLLALKSVEKKLVSLKSEDIKKLTDYCKKLKENFKATEEKLEQDSDAKNEVLLEMGNQIEALNNKAAELEESNKSIVDSLVLIKDEIDEEKQTFAEFKKKIKMNEKKIMEKINQNMNAINNAVPNKENTDNIKNTVNSKENENSNHNNSINNIQSEILVELTRQYEELKTEMEGLKGNLIKNNEKIYTLEKESSVNQQQQSLNDKKEKMLNEEKLKENLEIETIKKEIKGLIESLNTTKTNIQEKYDSEFLLIKEENKKNSNQNISLSTKIDSIEKSLREDVDELKESNFIEKQILEEMANKIEYLEKHIQDISKKMKLDKTNKSSSVINNNNTNNQSNNMNNINKETNSNNDTDNLLKNRVHEQELELAKIKNRVSELTNLINTKTDKTNHKDNKESDNMRNNETIEIKAKVKELNSILDTHSEILQLLGEKLNDVEEQSNNNEKKIKENKNGNSKEMEANINNLKIELSNFIFTTNEKLSDIDNKNNKNNENSKDSASVKEILRLENVINTNTEAISYINIKIKNIEDTNLIDKNEMKKEITSIDANTKPLLSQMSKLSKQIYDNSDGLNEHINKNKEQITNILQRLNEVVEYFEKKNQAQESNIESIMNSIVEIKKTDGELYNEMNNLAEELNDHLSKPHYYDNRNNLQTPMSYDNVNSGIHSKPFTQSKNVVRGNNNIENNIQKPFSPSSYLSNYDEEENHVEGQVNYYQSGFVSSFQKQFIISKGREAKEKFSLSRADNSLNEVDIVSKKSNISMFNNSKTIPERQRKKYQDNNLYLSTSPLYYIEVKDQLPGYLPKSLHFKNDLQNVLEIEVETNQEDMEFNDYKKEDAVANDSILDAFEHSGSGFS